MTNKTSSRFTDLSPLGEGGMASVYRAHDSSFNGLVALKRLHSSLAHDEVEKKRLLREARVCQKLRHPNIVKVLDVVEEDGELGLVMELVVGENLRTRMARGVTIEEAVQLLIQIAKALDYAHKENVIHRDLKPGNIFVTGKNLVKIGDWGLTRTQEDTSGLTKTGILLGTPRYMAPEQIKGLEPTPAVDMYAFGVMLYEMVTKGSPFPAVDLASQLRAHLDKRAPRLRTVVTNVPPTLDKLASALLNKEPQKRPSAAETIKMLQTSLKEEPAANKATATSLSGVRPLAAIKTNQAPSQKFRSYIGLFAMILLATMGTYFLQSKHLKKRPANDKKRALQEAHEKHAIKRFRSGVKDFLNGNSTEMRLEAREAIKEIDPLIVLDPIWDFALSTAEEYTDKAEINAAKYRLTLQKLIVLAKIFKEVAPANSPNDPLDKVAIPLAEHLHNAFMSMGQAIDRKYRERKGRQSQVPEITKLGAMVKRITRLDAKYGPLEKIAYSKVGDELAKWRKSGPLHPAIIVFDILLLRRLKKNELVIELCKNLRQLMENAPWSNSPHRNEIIAISYNNQAEASKEAPRSTRIKLAEEIIDFLVNEIDEIESLAPDAQVDNSILKATAALQNTVRYFWEKGATGPEIKIGEELTKQFLEKSKHRPKLMIFGFNYLHHYGARTEIRRKAMREDLEEMWKELGWGRLPTIEVEAIKAPLSKLKGKISDPDNENTKTNFSWCVSYAERRAATTKVDGTFEISIPAAAKNGKEREIDIRIQDFPKDSLYIELYMEPESELLEKLKKNHFQSK